MQYGRRDDAEGQASNAAYIARGIFERFAGGVAKSTGHCPTSPAEAAPTLSLICCG